MFPPGRTFVAVCAMPNLVLGVKVIAMKPKDFIAMQQAAPARLS
jgi:hypothetical protein